MSEKDKGVGYFKDSAKLKKGTQEPGNLTDDVLDTLNVFENRRAQGFWPHISRAKLAEGLRGRLYDPDVVNQKYTGLCGFVAMVRVWARDIPDTYLAFAIDLYEKGVGTMRGKNTHSVRTIRPSVELRNHNPPPEIDPADWLVSASIRESLNLVLDYSPGEGVFQIEALTWPWDPEKQFRALGYTKIRGGCTVHQSQGYESLKTASNLYEAGWRVIMLVNSWLLERGSLPAVKFPNHYVALNSPIVKCLTPGPPLLNEFSLWSWGATHKIPKNGRYIPLQTVVDNYYGYVAGKF